MTTVFLDIDTQIDFMFPAGALYVPGAEKILPSIVRLNRFAAERGFQLVSTMCAHSENDPEFKEWPPHCVVGTTGQQKPADTLLDRSLTVTAQSASTEPRALASGQIILEKQQIDLFTNPALPDLLRRLNAGRYVVYGVVTEHCVRCAAFGLLDTKKPVTLVQDAIAEVDPVKADRVLREFVEKGGTLSTVSEICSQ
ncbi:MAG: isochorismatase family protein [Bryobacteraceae bacterium]